MGLKLVFAFPDMIVVEYWRDGDWRRCIRPMDVSKIALLGEEWDECPSEAQCHHLTMVT